MTSTYAILLALLGATFVGALPLVDTHQILAFEREGQHYRACIGPFMLRKVDSHDMLIVIQVGEG